MKLRTCVSPEGKFVYGIHRPSYTVENMRENDAISPLGRFADGSLNDNRVNFPPADVAVGQGGTVYEIPNPFPFRGTTYINKEWADQAAADPSRIRLPAPPEVSFGSTVRQWFGEAQPHPNQVDHLFRILPEPFLLTLAETGTDPEDLVRLAELSCEFVRDVKSGQPVGLKFERDEKGRSHPVIYKHLLFETVANNSRLPDPFKAAMVLRPGVQGGSPIVGEWQDRDDRTHIFEYLRANSYIPWGHYAANMADNAVRYRIADLTADDMRGLRHLYYQRTYVRIAESLGLGVNARRRTLSAAELEGIRRDIRNLLKMENKRDGLRFNRTLWGWNFGFDYAPSGYRLHASHQQVHQQFALIPRNVSSQGSTDDAIPAYACGDMVESFIAEYRAMTGVGFFDAYIRAIENNDRLAGAPTGETSLVVHADERVLLFVPKAQTSQWELQLMTRTPVGNVIEADRETREAIDAAMLMAVKTLSGLGARMITTIEYSKRFDAGDTGQRLIYSFLPRLPESPGAFSEAQLRWINGHYPEDFAAACRQALKIIG